ncbi:hypothetical protein Q7P37_004072 [Cladosporium fusiforme]
MVFSKLVVLSFAASAFAIDPELPVITAAARLYRRQEDPAFVGLVGDQFDEPRSCDFPQTVSTSGSFVQCCPTSGACPFYTTCSSNTLVASNATVPCDVDPALTCNTGWVLTADNDLNTGSYLACWQTSLGTSPFTILRNLDATATSAPGNASSSSSSTSKETSSSASDGSSSTSSTDSANDSTASGASETSSSAAAAVVGGSEYRRGGLLGAVIFAVQMIL